MSAGLRDLARRLGGEVSGAEVLCPGPGHGPRDRSLSVRPSADSPDGFITYSFANDDWRACLDHVRHLLGLERRVFSPSPTKPAKTRNVAKSDSDYERRQHETAGWLWGRREPISGSIGEHYLRGARGCDGPLPPTLGFLRAYKDHPPALICAFALALDEIEPSILAEPRNVESVQLIALKPDGSGKANVTDGVVKRHVGAHTGLPIVVSPINDGLGLSIHEGVEDALSAFEATGLGCWASGGAAFLAALTDAVPGYVECITIAEHNDAAGQAGAYELARRLAERGVNVLLGGAGDGRP